MKEDKTDEMDNYLTLLPSDNINNLPIKSFGGTDLQTNIKKSETALQEMKPLRAIWNRSHSQWTWRHLNLNFVHPLKNMRQISAEITAKGDALNSAKWSHRKGQINEQEKREALKNKDLNKWDRLKIELELAETEESIENGLLMIEGCVKDILSLHELYNTLKEEVGDFDENDIEEEESKAHLQRSLLQCLRDVRERGSITAGQQEYLENIGANPSKTQVVLRAYVEKEASADADWSTEELYKFIRELTVELIDRQGIDKTRMINQHLLSEHNPEFAREDIFTKGDDDG
jgi:hypothetical protein